MFNSLTLGARSYHGASCAADYFSFVLSALARNDLMVFGFASWHIFYASAWLLILIDRGPGISNGQFKLRGSMIW